MTTSLETKHHHLTSPILETNFGVDATKLLDDSSFPLDSLPLTIREMVKDVSNMVQIDPAMASTITLAAIAGCISHVTVKLESNDFTAPHNLFMLVIAAPGEGKSPALAALLKPMYQIERELLKAHLSKQSDERAEKRLLSDRVIYLQKIAKKGSPDVKADFLAAHQALETMEETPPPRFIFDDVTSEALVEVLHGRGRAMVASAEGGVLATWGGRYSNGLANLDAILKAYDGDPVSVDRKGKLPLVLPRPLLTLLLLVQHRTWEEVKADPVFQGRGLLQRLLIVEPTSRVGFRSFDNTKQSKKIADLYSELVHQLLENFDQENLVLDIRGEANSLLATYSRSIERDLQPENRFGASDLHKEWGSKLFSKAVRLCGIVHFAQHGRMALDEPVSAKSASDAIVIAEWFANEWLRIMPVIPVAETLAEKIIEWITNEQIEMFSQSQISLQFRNHYRAKDIRPALALLEERGYLFSEKSPHGFGRPTQNYFRNV